MRLLNGELQSFQTGAHLEGGAPRESRKRHTLPHKPRPAHLSSSCSSVSFTRAFLINWEMQKKKKNVGWCFNFSLPPLVYTHTHTHIHTHIHTHTHSISAAKEKGQDRHIWGMMNNDVGDY